MSNMTMIKDIPDPAGKPKYMWKKEWVRPHESLWSVMRNFRIVNGHCSYKEALDLLGIQLVGNPKQYIGVESKYGIYSRYTIRKKWGEVIEKELFPQWYMEKITTFSKLMTNAPRLVSKKLRYCPKCMEHGYHSYIHQLAGIRTCPFHERQKLKNDTTQTYVWGESRKFEYDRDDDYYCRRLVFNLFDRDTCDFDDEIMGRLPSEWHTPDDFLNKLKSTGIYSDYDSVRAVASDIEFRNTDIYGGRLFLSAGKRDPFVTIYDAKYLDICEYGTFAKEIKEMGLKNLYLYDIDTNVERLQYIQYAKKLLLLIIARKFMSGISTEEIRRAEGNLLTKGFVDFRDDIGAKTMFLWEYTHCKLIHEYLNIDDYEQLGSYTARYKPKRFCVEELLSSDIWWNYGLSTFIHILEDHIQSCFREFIEFLTYDPEYREDGLHFNDVYDLLGTPTYVVEKTGEIIKIYKSN